MLAGPTLLVTKPSDGETWPVPNLLCKRLGMVCHQILLTYAHVRRPFSRARAEDGVAFDALNDVLQLGDAT